MNILCFSFLWTNKGEGWDQDNLENEIVDTENPNFDKFDAKMCEFHYFTL